jgi:hypothetical protein
MIVSRNEATRAAELASQKVEKCQACAISSINIAFEIRIYYDIANKFQI